MAAFWFWVIVAVAFAIAEVMTVAFFAAFIAVGALGAAIVSLLGKRWLAAFSASPRMATPRASVPPEQE